MEPSWSGFATAASWGFSPGVVVTAVQVVKLSDSTTAQVTDAGDANPDSNFRFDPTLGGSGGYAFNLKTTGLSTGTYALA
jgi:hypothetical protein